MLVFKIIGGLCIIGATTLYGRGLAGEYTCRLDSLKALKRAFNVLKGELRYGVETLPAAFMHVGERCSLGDEDVRDFFWAVGGRLADDTGKRLKAVWEEEAKKLAAATHLNGAECDRLIQVSECLGYLDLTQQVSNIELYMDELEEDIQILSEKYADTCKMYTSLGVMAGLFLTIILV